MIGTTNGMQNSTGYQRIDEGEERQLVEPFSIWAKRMISKPLYLFLAAVIIIGGITVCVNHPWSQEHKKKYPIIMQLPYEGAELFEYAEYTFGINASVVLSNSSLHLTIWEIVVPLLSQPFIDCPEEPYNITSEGSTTTITLTNTNDSSDCIYKKLHDSIPSKLKMEVSNKMEYDAFHEQITVHFTILDLIKFDVRTYPTTSGPTQSPTPKTPTLSPTSEKPSKSPTRNPTLSPTTLIPTRIPTKRPTRSPASDPTTAFPTGSPTVKPTSTPTKLPTFTPTVKTQPAGVYAGNKTILGQDIGGQMVFIDEGVCDLQILVDAANLNITCMNEPYTMSGFIVMLTGVDSAGDCVHDGLSDNDVTLVSISFMEALDEVELLVKYHHVPETLVLNHKNEQSSSSFAYIIS